MPLQKDLTALLKSYSVENGSNALDAILAEYLLSCLEVFNKAVRSRKALTALANAGQYPNVSAMLADMPGPQEQMNQCGAMARFIDDLDDIIEQEEDRKE